MLSMGSWALYPDDNLSLLFLYCILGHELVWHGSVDIVFSSHQGIPAKVNAVVENEEIAHVKKKLDEGDGKVAHFIFKKDYKYCILCQSIK